MDIRVRSHLVLAALVMLVCSEGTNAQRAADSNNAECPVITVTGPAGVAQPGDLIWFDVSLSPEQPKKLKFYWTTNQGRVNEGRPASRISVKYLTEMRGTELIVTVKVTGLPPNCPDSASASHPLIWEPEPLLIADFSVPVSAVGRKNLRVAADVLAKNPNSQMYIIEYFRPQTSEALKRRKANSIMKFFTEVVKFDRDRVNIVFAEALRVRSKIYQVPPGSDNPTP